VANRRRSFPIPLFRARDVELQAFTPSLRKLDVLLENHVLRHHKLRGMGGSGDGKEKQPGKQAAHSGRLPASRTMASRVYAPTSSERAFLDGAGFSGALWRRR